MFPRPGNREERCFNRNQVRQNDIDNRIECQVLAHPLCTFPTDDPHRFSIISVFVMNIPKRIGANRWLTNAKESGRKVLHENEPFPERFVRKFRPLILHANQPIYVSLWITKFGLVQRAVFDLNYLLPLQLITRRNTSCTCRNEG